VLVSDAEVVTVPEVGNKSEKGFGMIFEVVVDTAMVGLRKGLVSSDVNGDTVKVRVVAVPFVGLKGWLMKGENGLVTWEELEIKLGSEEGRVAAADGEAETEAGVWIVAMVADAEGIRNGSNSSLISCGTAPAPAC
jgi:hypothetical protein